MTRGTICLLGFATALAVSCAAPHRIERGSSEVGARLQLSAPDLDGRDVDVGAAQGKVRVVDFWATWCEPCKEAMPVLDALSRDLAPRGVAVYGISIDEDRAQIAQFLEKTPVSFPVLWDKGAVRVKRFDVGYMPVTLIVDRAGVIRFVHQGWDEGRARLERKEVEALLAEP
jgi:cytochrome c biogenesis protein CcmG/thiol:disulfide interchange protein DsbE